MYTADVKGYVDGAKVLVGKPSLLGSKQHALSTGIEEKIRELQEQAKTVMMVAKDKRIIGLIAVADMRARCHTNRNLRAASSSHR